MEGVEGGRGSGGRERASDRVLPVLVQAEIESLEAAYSIHFGQEKNFVDTKFAKS